jgi:hypothetical protein
MVAQLLRQYWTVETIRVKGHAGTPRNERADALASKAAGKAAWLSIVSLAHMKLQMSEKFRRSKEEWHNDPYYHGSEEIPLPTPKSTVWIATETL